MTPEEIARLKAAGFSDAEIAAHQRTPAAGPQSFASESTAARGPVSAPRDNTLASVPRAVAQGATFGFADEIEAGGRSLLPKGYGGGDYRTLRDDIRQQNDAYSAAHPMTAFLANVGGGLLTGGGVMKAAQGVGRLAGFAKVLAPNVNAAATTGARVLQGVKAGAGAGALAGAGGAKELSDVPLAMTVNAGIGAGLGAGFGVAGDVVRGGRNIVSRIGQGQDAAGPIRRMLRADAPESAAIKRVLALFGNQKMSVDDFAARSAAADAPDIAAEVIGSRGIRAVRTARGLGYDAPDMIEQGLTTRARDDVGRVRSTVTTELGAQLDDEALKQSKLVEARRAASPLYEQALDGVTVEDPRLVTMLERPAIRSAFGRARTMAANDGDALPTAFSIERGASRGVGDAVEDVGARATRTVPLADDGVPRNLATLSDDDLNTAMARVAALRDEDLAASQLIPEHVRTAVGEEGSAGMSAARMAERRAAARARGLNDREIGAEGGALSEDMLGAIESAGYDPGEWVSAHRTMAQAQFRLRARDASMARLEAEAARRGVPPATGTQAGERAMSLPHEGDAPELPKLGGRQLQYVKLALDDGLKELEAKVGGTATTRYAQMVKARNEIDGLLYEFSNAAEDGGSLWGQANAAFAKPMQEAEAFSTGVRAGRTIQAPDVPRLLAGEHPEWTSRGVANTIHDDLGKMGDGTVGPLRDPAPALMGSSAARARLEVAAGGDLGRIGRVEDAASNAARRLRTRQIVTGGSQTAEKLADQAEQGMSPSQLLAVAQNPTGGLLGALGTGANALQRNLVGQDMDALAKLLMAGGPSQMSRAELVDLIRKALPQLEQAQRRSLLIRGQMANQTGQRVQP